MEFLTKPQLRERGWSAAMIHRFLGDPDSSKRNPRFRTAAPMKLYRLDRVAEAEDTGEWGEAREKAQRRSAAGRTRAEGERRRTREVIDAIPVHVTRMPLEKARANAIRHFNKRAWAAADKDLVRGGSGDFLEASEDSDPAFLARITVNYLRHQASGYESALERAAEEVAGSTGAREFQPHIRERVLDALASTYPGLAAECARQKHAGRIYAPAAR